MHGFFSSWRAALLYLLAWAMLGLLLAAMLAVGGAGWSAGLVFALPLALVYAFATGFSTYYVCRAYPLGRRGGLSTAMGLGLTALCAAGLWCAIGAAWNGLWRTLAPQTAIDFNPVVTASMFALGVLLYGLSAAVNYLMIETERVRQLETQRLQMMVLAQDAELRMLRTQVDPHFLFNSLNSVSALVAIDAGRARAMIVQLADFFRHSLGMQAGRKVRLDDELQLVRHFVAIEQVRFGERLLFEAEVETAARACLLPPMLLQPLVENAVKHGIARMLGQGRVRLSARCAGALLRVCVENDVDPDDVPDAPSRGTGVGLENVRQRLRAAYGHEAQVRWGGVDGVAAFRVELTLPVETVEDRACVW
jgi:two-component system sensor histidine kinase AlgZ